MISSPIFIVSRNEFYRLICNPFIILISVILFVFAFLNGYGGSTLLHESDGGAGNGPDVFLNIAFGQILVSTIISCTIIAVFVGAMSVAEDRSNGTMRMLLSKPLYRRDVVIGKFTGLSVFLLLYITGYIAICTMLIALFFRPPFFFDEFLLRISIYIFLIFIDCALSMAITMLFGILFRDLLKVAVLAVSFLFLDWYAVLGASVGFLLYFSPSDLFFQSIGLGTNYLLDTTISLSSWFQSAGTSVVIMVTLAACLCFAECLVFTKMDE